jgi:crotonobetainyl-CoA:carnitine CoA-transferase CaiB-like acyl-CoA transferase
MADGALQGITVIELGQMVSAPYCAKLFADFGADVIKVEPPSGDITRRWGPFPKDEPHPEKSGLFFFLNTNKRGVTLDVGTREGRDRLLDLLRQADVLIENNRPQQMRDWGLDYASIAKVNPELMMISITPYGQTGPYADWNGYDLNAYHLSACGSSYLGRAHEAPLEPGTFAADFYGAGAGAAWGLAAVYGREHGGGGQHIDVSCAEVIGALFVGAENIGGYAQDRVFRSRVDMGLLAPGQIVPCKDGYVWTLAFMPGEWLGLAKAMGDPDWMHQEMFLDMWERAKLADAVNPLIQQWAMEHTKMEIMEWCQANGNPTTAVFDVAEAAEHPHIRERGYIVEVEHPAMGRVRDLGPPFKLPESPGSPVQGAPLLGQHNAEVFGTLLGMSAADLTRLRRGGVI